MSDRFKDYNPDQLYLLPPSLNAWLPGSHLTYFIRDAVDALDLSEIMKPYWRRSLREELGISCFFLAAPIQIFY